MTKKKKKENPLHSLTHTDKDGRAEALHTTAPGVLSTTARVSHAKTQSDNTLFTLKFGKYLVAQHYSR